MTAVQMVIRKSDYAFRVKEQAKFDKIVIDENETL